MELPLQPVCLKLRLDQPHNFPWYRSVLSLRVSNRLGTSTRQGNQTRTPRMSPSVSQAKGIHAIPGTHTDVARYSSRLVIDRTSLYWGLLTILVLAVLFSSYLVG